MKTTVPALLWRDLTEEVLKLTPARHRPMMSHLLQVTRDCGESLSSRALARELSVLFLLAAAPDHVPASPSMEAAMP